MPETKGEDVARLKARVVELEEYSVYAVRTIAEELREVRRWTDVVARDVGVTIPDSVCKPSDRLVVLLNGMGKLMGAQAGALMCIGKGRN
ncbi:MAG TPA: hypothetical protein VMY87_06320 [Armatimonadota bacterium]|nr:hypothetical protein [Armatimonadota bacterium]